MDNPALRCHNSRTAFRRDGGQLQYDIPRHSGAPPRASAITRNAVRDQPGMGVRDQWNAQSPDGLRPVRATLDPCMQFTNAFARLGANVVRYTFMVADLHRLLHRSPGALGLLRGTCSSVPT